GDAQAGTRQGPVAPPRDETLLRPHFIAVIEIAHRLVEMVGEGDGRHVGVGLEFVDVTDIAADTEEIDAIPSHASRSPPAGTCVLAAWPWSALNEGQRHASCHEREQHENYRCFLEANDGLFFQLVVGVVAVHRSVSRAELPRIHAAFVTFSGL